MATNGSTVPTPAGAGPAELLGIVSDMGSMLVGVGGDGLVKTRQTTSEHGVLAGTEGDYTLRRVPTGPAVRALVERHWRVDWALPPGRESAVTMLPHPAVNL